MSAADTAGRTEQAMRFWFDQGKWPTATALNAVAERFGLNRGGGVGREDLNGRECQIREELAKRYGWHRVYHRRHVTWEKYDHYFCGSNYCDDPACVSNQPDNPDYFPHPEAL